jgi:hypothetical protein
MQAATSDYLVIHSEDSLGPGSKRKELGGTKVTFFYIRANAVDVEGMNSKIKHSKHGKKMNTK